MRHKWNPKETGFMMKQEQRPGRELNIGRSQSVIIKILMIFYVLLGSMGCLQAVTSSAKISCYKGILILWMFLVSCGMVLLFDRRKKRIFRLALVAGGYSGILVLGMPLFSESVQGILQAIFYYLNPYYGWDLQTGAGTGNISVLSNTTGLLVLFVPVIIMLAYGATSIRHYYVCTVIMGGGIVAPFLYGEVPNGWSVCMTGTAFAGLVVMKQSAVLIEGKEQFSFMKVQKKVGLLIPGVAVLTVVSGMLLSQMVIAPAFSDHKLIKAKFEYAVQKYTNISFRRNQAKGGVNEGNLGTADELVADNQVQLKIVTDHLPMQTLYLQGYIGSWYSDNRWREAGDRTLRNWNDGALQAYSGVDMHNMAYEFISRSAGGFAGESKHTLNVEVVDSNTKYRYIPYGSFYQNEDPVREDTYVYGRGEPIYSVEFYPMDGAVYRDYGGLVQNVLEDREMFENAWYDAEVFVKSEAEEMYEAYVRDTYLQVPEHIQDSFDDVLGRITQKDAYTSALQVAALLAQQTEYSLQPGRTPFGKDFATYFYFENKRGYCVHYATVATLLLRMNQVPARFVSGYAVNPNDFNRLEDGRYEALVTGDNAHAWAEVYYQRLGWLPVETTPGYYGSATAAGNGNVLEDEVWQEEHTTTQEEQLQDQPQEQGPEDPGEEEQNTPGETDAEKELQKNGEIGFGLFGKGLGVTEKAGKVLLAIVSVILTGIGMLIVRRRMMIAIRCRKGGKDWSESVRFLFRELYEVFVFAGMPGKTDCLEVSFPNRICEICEEVSKADAETLMELVMRAHYAKEKLTKEEYLFVKEVYQKSVVTVQAQLSFRKKIFFRYIKCF